MITVAEVPYLVLYVILIAASASFVLRSIGAIRVENFVYAILYGVVAFIIAGVAVNILYKFVNYAGSNSIIVLLCLLAGIILGVYGHR